MAEDKRTIGYTDAGLKIAERLNKLAWFKDEVELARFAFGCAVAKGAEVGARANAGTKWNRGTLDPDFEMQTVVQEFYGETEMPMRAIESLIDEGLKVLDECVSRNPSITLAEIIGEVGK